MDIDYDQLEDDVATGAFRIRLEEELREGFVRLRDAGEPLPPASHYASRIAEIVDRGADREIPAELSYQLYQEILSACEEARRAAGGDPPAAS